MAGKSLTIVNLCLGNRLGGLEMQAGLWTEYFSDHGYKAFTVCLKDSPFEKWLNEKNIPHKSVRAKKYLYWPTTKFLRQIIKDHDSQVAFLCHHLKDLWLLRPALFGFPKVKALGFARMTLGDVSKKDPMHRWVYSRLNYMVFLSEYQKIDLQKNLPIQASKLVHVPDSVDSSRFGPEKRSEKIRSALGVTPGDFLIGLVGRIDPKKGQKELIEAFDLAQKALPQQKLKLLILGHATEGDGSPYLKECKELINQLGLQDQIIIHGFVAETAPYMASLDLFVLPSYEETFGNVTIEAMCSGVPCVVTNTGGSPEIIKDGELGLTCPPKDPLALSEKIIEMINNPEKRNMMAKNAREDFYKKYAPNVIFEKVRTLIEEA